MRDEDIARLAQALSTWSGPIRGEGDPEFTAWAAQLIRSYARPALEPPHPDARATVPVEPGDLAAALDVERLARALMPGHLFDHPGDPSDCPHVDRREAHLVAEKIAREYAALDRPAPEPPPSYPSPGESAGFDRLVDDLRAEFDQGHFIPWDEVVARITARPAPEPLDVERLARAIRTAEARSQMDAERMGAAPVDDQPLPDWYRAYAVDVAREYAALAPTDPQETPE